MLTIQQRDVEPGIVVVEISGRITLGRESQQLEWLVSDLLAKQHKKVIFDLSSVTRLDSTGVGIIVLSCGKLRASGGDLKVAGATGNVAEIFRLTNLNQIVQLYPTAAAAAEKFATPPSPKQS